MHSPKTVAQVVELRSTGLGARRIARSTGLPVGTVRDWLAGRVPMHSRGTAPGVLTSGACEQCGHGSHSFERLPAAYVYLLGLYLGDGCISKHARAVFRLRVFLDVRYPVIVDECEAAMRAVMPHNKVHRLERSGSFAGSVEASNVEVSSFSKSWPCLIPQHGPGRKHDRAIVLMDWQRKLVEQWPGHLLRGLIHSDGCRFQNTGRAGWSWPRYSFSNKSSDIRSIFSEACDLLGVHWTTAKTTTIYVSKKVDVALLDTFIGPKQ